MSDRDAEFLAALLREYGPDAVADLVAAELRDAPPADVSTKQDAVMRLYGDGPCLEVVDD